MRSDSGIIPYSLLLLLCCAVVNTEWFRNHSSFEQRILPLIVNTEPFRKRLVLLVRMRSKLVVLLVSPHFQRVRTNELLLLMKSAWGWWLFIFAMLFKVMHSKFFIFYFTPFFLFHLGNIFWKTVKRTSARKWTLWCPSLTEWDRPFSVKRWNGRVLWGKRWMERLFFSRQSRHSYLWCYIFRQYFSLFVPWLGV